MYNRILNLCNKNSIKITNLCEDVTGSSGNLSTWKKGYMRSDYLAKVSQILGCTTDYLLGLSETATQYQVENEHIKIKDMQEMQLLSLFNQLTKEQKAAIIERAQVYVELNEDASRKEEIV